MAYKICYEPIAIDFNLTQQKYDSVRHFTTAYKITI